MIVVVGGIKGGSGKTTIATNLAVLRSMTHKVLLVDADDQKSAWDWFQQRQSADTRLLTGFVATVCMSGREVYASLLDIADEYDDIIVDTGGVDSASQRSALCIADKLILPFRPSSIDIWTMAPVKEILDYCINPNLKVYSIINQADPTGKDNQAAMEILRELESMQTFDCSIGNRKAFRNAMGEGLGVREMFFRDKKACQEIQILYDLIYV